MTFCWKNFAPLRLCEKSIILSAPLRLCEKKNSALPAHLRLCEKKT